MAMQVVDNGGDPSRLHSELTSLFRGAADVWQYVSSEPAAKLRLTVLAQDTERMSSIVYAAIGHRGRPSGKFKFLWHRSVYVAEISEEIWAEINLLLPPILGFPPAPGCAKKWRVMR